MRLSTAVKLVLAVAFIILSLMPFLHSYLHQNIIDQTDEDVKIEERTKEVVELLGKLKTTTTLFDDFLEERQRRKREREVERDRVLEKQRELGSIRQVTRESESSIIIANEASQNSQQKTSPNDVKTSDQQQQGEEDEIISKIEFRSGPFKRYVEDHNGALPILVVCHNRPRELGQTLDALLALPKIDESKILVAQDGSNAEVQAQAVKRKLKLEQNLSLEQQRMKESGERIARHYKFALEKAFQIFADAPAIIIMEDDLRVSPDFLEWFSSAGVLVENDPTLWCVSAWNDNGFKGLVKDPYGVRRTNLFPGLGWLLMRTEYVQNLANAWPNDNWDWIVRGIYQRKERECVYPEIPRTFHEGRVGTFVNENDQKNIFDRMARNERTDLDWSSPRAVESLKGAMQVPYDNRIERILKHPSTVHIQNASAFEEIVAEETCENVVVWYTADPNPKSEKRVLRFAKYFGIWHQLLRASHESVHEIYFKSCRVFLINLFEARPVHSLWFTTYTHPTRFTHFRPADVPVFDPEEFINDVENLSVQTNLVVANSFGASCHQTCASAGLRCDTSKLKSINNCATLKKYFPCKSCEGSIGPDQPCYVNPTAPQKNLPGSCLHTMDDVVTCEGSHPLTKRVCPCTK